MTKNEQQHRGRDSEEESDNIPEPEAVSKSVPKDKTASNETAEEKSDELTEILDEIDTLLSSNAEEFVASYVQKGGE